MHPLQRHILKSLTFGETVRFKDMKPRGIESNRFIYHLQRLIAAGYVKKLARGYTLTALGNRYVDKLSLGSFELRAQPKIVTLIVCKNRKGEYLLYRRKRQPFIGMVGFPYGKIHFGETIQKAAERELSEKTGIRARLRHLGDAYLTVYLQGELATHMLCHVFSGGNPSGTLAEDSPIGTCFWEKIDVVGTKTFIPGFREVYTLVKKHKPFFAELTIGT